jgi:hypothetical protein
MFFGEFSCLIAFFIVFFLKKHHWNRRRQNAQQNQVFDLEPEDEEEPQLPKFNPLIFLPPGNFGKLNIGCKKYIFSLKIMEFLE